MIDRDDFEIAEDTSKSPTRYYVVPSLAYLRKMMDSDYPHPYDTNWEFYSTFKMNPQKFINYIETERNATVELVGGFPYMSFYFKSYCNASLFLTDFYNRKNNLFPEKSD